jgi:hypothetical protein
MTNLPYQIWCKTLRYSEEPSFPPPSRKEKELTLAAPLLQSFQTLTLNINDMTPVQLYLSNIENLVKRIPSTSLVHTKNLLTAWAFSNHYLLCAHQACWLSNDLSEYISEQLICTVYIVLLLPQISCKLEVKQFFNLFNYKGPICLVWHQAPPKLFQTFFTKLIGPQK